MPNPNLSSFLKPEVEIKAFLRMRSGKTAKMDLKSHTVLLKSGRFCECAVGKLTKVGLNLHFFG